MATIDRLAEEIKAERAKLQTLDAKLEAKDEAGKLVLDNDAVQGVVDDILAVNTNIATLRRNFDILEAKQDEISAQFEYAPKQPVVPNAEREIQLGGRRIAFNEYGLPLDAKGHSPARQLMNSFGEDNRDMKRSGEIQIANLASTLWSPGGRSAQLAQPVGTADFETQRPFYSVVQMPVQPPRFLDGLTRIPADKNKFDWLKQTTRTIGAGAVAEGAAASASDFVWTKQAVALKRIRHITGVTEDILTSEPLLNGLIQAEMLSGLMEALSTQALIGSGVDPNITGLTILPTSTGNVNAVTAFTLVASGNAAHLTRARNIIDGLSEGLRDCMTVGRAMPDHVYIHPTVWGYVEDVFAEGAYVWSHPSQASPSTIRGVPITTTTEFGALAASTDFAALGAFGQYLPLFNRGPVVLETTDSHGDAFAEWEITMRIGIYADLVATRPQAFATLSASAI